MELEALWSKYPVVYHMASPGSWPSIQQRGLLSTSALLDLFEISGPERVNIEARRRPGRVTISHPVNGTATIRDQKPLHDSMLERCLRGKVTVEDWHRLLNGRVFFWVDQKRLKDLRNARAYRDERQTVIFADSHTLIERYAPRIRLTHINTGATRSVFHYRDFQTFSTIEDYSRLTVAELTVDYSVPDLAEFVTSVADIGGPEGESVVWP